MQEKSEEKSDERVPMYDAWYYVCTYLSVNGALEVSVEGAEGVGLGGKGQIHHLQSGLGGGEGPVTVAMGRASTAT
jgi:hypothetical protein